MNKICVYAICKDEIQNVDQWLDSMSEADYIVVLDTGSTDGTFEKLKVDPRVTKVQRGNIKPWRFDVARNRSMRLVPKDANILLCTDLDERLEPGWGDIIRATWRENTLRGHYKYVWSHTESGADGHTFTYDKLHTKDYKWYYPVHEVLGPKVGIETQFEIETPERVIEYGDKIVLRHYPDKSKSRASYLDLLRLRVEENPDECYGMHLLGREYASYGQYDMALMYLEKTLNLPSISKSPLIQHATLGYMGDIYLMRRDYTDAMTCFMLQIQNSPSHREAYLSMAEIYYHLKMYDVALSFIKEALDKTYQHFDWTEHESTWNERVDDLFSVIYSELGEYEKALPCAVRALKKCPNNKRLQDNYLNIISKVEDKVETDG